MSYPIRTRKALEEAMRVIWSSDPKRDPKAAIQELLDAANRADTRTFQLEIQEANRLKDNTYLLERAEKAEARVKALEDAAKDRDAVLAYLGIESDESALEAAKRTVEKFKARIQWIEDHEDQALRARDHDDEDRRAAVQEMGGWKERALQAEARVKALETEREKLRAILSPKSGLTGEARLALAQTYVADAEIVDELEAERDQLDRLLF